MDESLADLRKQIDALDSQLSEMLAARLEVSRKVSAAKKDNSPGFQTGQRSPAFWANCWPLPRPVCSS